MIGFSIVTKYLKLDWDASVMTRAQIGFFLSHVVMQIPAGMKAEEYGGKIVMQLSMFFCSFISLLTPLSIIMRCKEFFILFVSLQGLGEGCFIPTFYVFTSQWVPLQERSKLFSAAFAGMHFGSLVGVPLIKVITDKWWFSGFILSAILGFLWVIMSIFFVRLWRPRKRLSMRSRRNLQLVFGMVDITETGARLKVPWAKILSSLPFWSTMFSHFGAVWTSSIFLRDLSYFTSVHEISMEPEFLIRPFMVSLLAIVVFIIFVEIMKNYRVRTEIRRKIMNSICLWGSSLMLIVMAISAEYDTNFQPIYFMVGAACTSASYTGVYLNHAELSPIFAGTLMGISNVVGNSANIIKPVIRHNMVRDEKIDKTRCDSKSEWSMYFLVNAVILFFINIPFVLYGTSNEQMWQLADEPQEELDNGLDTGSNSLDLVNRRKNSSILNHTSRSTAEKGISANIEEISLGESDPFQHE